jgi:hypothetical protein
MKVKVQLVVCDDNGHEETITDVVDGWILCLRVNSLNGPLLVRFLSINLKPYTVEEKAYDHDSDPQRP